MIIRLKNTQNAILKNILKRGDADWKSLDFCVWRFNLHIGRQTRLTRFCGLTYFDMNFLFRVLVRSLWMSFHLRLTHGALKTSSFASKLCKIRNGKKRWAIRIDFAGLNQNFASSNTKKITRKLPMQPRPAAAAIGNSAMRFCFNLSLCREIYVKTKTSVFQSLSQHYVANMH